MFQKQTIKITSMCMPCYMKPLDHIWECSCNCHDKDMGRLAETEKPKEIESAPVRELIQVGPAIPIETITEEEIKEIKKVIEAPEKSDYKPEMRYMADMIEALKKDMEQLRAESFRKKIQGRTIGISWLRAILLTATGAIIGFIVGLLV